MAFTRFTSDFGNPALVVSDRGTQLTKAGRLVNENQDIAPKWDWAAIQNSAARSGTRWVFVEAGSQWRNGLETGCLLKEKYDGCVPMMAVYDGCSGC